MRRRQKDRDKSPHPFLSRGNPPRTLPLPSAIWNPRGIQLGARESLVIAAIELSEREYPSRKAGGGGSRAGGRFAETLTRSVDLEACLRSEGWDPNARPQT